MADTTFTETQITNTMMRLSDHLLPYITDAAEIAALRERAITDLTARQSPYYGVW